MGDYIITSNHIKMNPCNPKEEDICIEDIAHALSLMCRANGHFPVFFSVAQHCLMCLDEAKARGYSRQMQLACLLHDASEAYLSEVTRPVKQHLPQYREVEARLEKTIYHKFLGRKLTDEEMGLIKSVDDDMLYYEFYHFTGEKLYDSAPVIASEPVFMQLSFAEVEQRFVQEFQMLQCETASENAN